LMSLRIPAEMAPAYEAVCEELGWELNAAKLEALQKANQQRLEQLDATIKDAEENLGDVEVREARAAKADYLCKIGKCRCPPTC
jgi:26S proteasome regulatory subunit N7